MNQRADELVDGVKSFPAVLLVAIALAVTISAAMPASCGRGASAAVGLRPSLQAGTGYCTATLTVGDLPKTITSSGVYCLGSNIWYHVPNAASAHFIRIPQGDHSNIVVDFGGYGVTQHSSGFAEANGIEIAGAGNYIIRNGEIRGGDDGVDIQNSAANILVEDMRFVLLSDAVFVEDSTANVVVRRCYFYHDQHGLVHLGDGRSVVRDGIFTAFPGDDNGSCGIEYRNQLNNPPIFKGFGIAEENLIIDVRNDGIAAKLAQPNQVSARKNNVLKASNMPYNLPVGTNVRDNDPP